MGRLYGPCKRKCQYSSREIARIYGTRKMALQPGLMLYVYECVICKKFHLTKQKQSGSQFAAS